MNGNTLKIVFTGIISILGFVLIIMTILVCFKIIPIADYKEILGILGIPTLFGMISQSFLHSDFNKDGIPDSKQIDSNEQKPKEEKPNV